MLAEPLTGISWRKQQPANLMYRMAAKAYLSFYNILNKIPDIKVPKKDQIERDKVLVVNIKNPFNIYNYSHPKITGENVDMYI